MVIELKEEGKLDENLINYYTKEANIIRFLKARKFNKSKAH